VDVFVKACVSQKSLLSALALCLPDHGELEKRGHTGPLGSKGTAC
jgi:hypothetical protein